jgi:hypothetical protein
VAPCSRRSPPQPNQAVTGESDAEQHFACDGGSPSWLPSASLSAGTAAAGDALEDVLVTQVDGLLIVAEDGSVAERKKIQNKKTQKRNKNKRKPS